MVQTTRQDNGTRDRADNQRWACIARFAVCSATVIALSLILGMFAKAEADGPSPDVLANLPTAEFSKWSQTFVDESTGKPTAYEAAVVARLRNDKLTSQDSILGVVHAWSWYEESVTPVSVPGHPELYLPETQRVIRELIPLAANYQQTQGRLYLSLATYMQLANAPTLADDAYQHATQLLSDCYWSVARPRVLAMVMLGSATLDSGRPIEAQQMFSDVLEVPGYFEGPAIDRSYYRNYADAAARGMIKCLRGQLAALQGLYLDSDIKRDVALDLNEAITDAKLRLERSQTKPQSAPSPQAITQPPPNQASPLVSTQPQAIAVPTPK